MRQNAKHPNTTVCVCAASSFLVRSFFANAGSKFVGIVFHGIAVRWTVLRVG